MNTPNDLFTAVANDLTPLLAEEGRDKRLFTSAEWLESCGADASKLDKCVVLALYAPSLLGALNGLYGFNAMNQAEKGLHEVAQRHGLRVEEHSLSIVLFLRQEAPLVIVSVPTDQLSKVLSSDD
jgi:hypothetical protein